LDHTLRLDMIRPGHLIGIKSTPQENPLDG